MAGPGYLLMDGAHADDLAGRLRDGGNDAAALELPGGGARAKELARQVHPDDGIPLFERHLVERGVPLQAGVADQHVQRAELGDGGGEHPLDVLLLADIGSKRDGAAAHAMDFMRHLLGGFRIG